MRKGFKSSRGAMRGTIDGVPICRNGAPDFATVAIGVGPFVSSFFSELFALPLFLPAYFTWPEFQNSISRNPFIHLPQTGARCRYTHRGRPWSRSAPARFPPEEEWKPLRRRACRTPGRAPADVKGLRPVGCRTCPPPAM